MMIMTGMIAGTRPAGKLRGNNAGGSGKYTGCVPWQFVILLHLMI
jgi:hypothetical protein